MSHLLLSGIVVFMRVLNPSHNGIGELILWMKTGVPGEKPSERDKNQQQSQLTYDTEPELNIRPHWWEATILTTVPFLFPSEQSMLAYLSRSGDCTLQIIVPANQLNFDLFRRKKLLRELKLNRNPKVTNSLLTFYWLIRYGEVCMQAKWPIRPELIPVSEALSDQEYFYFPHPLDGMLVHRRGTFQH